MYADNNKRIAKNTAMLYIRMLITMGVSLYTSRIVLNKLGVEDFGLYNVVGGVVTIFSFLNNAMATSTQRYLSFEIGKKNSQKLKNIFSMSVNIHLIIALIILVLAETVGFWFMKNYLVIPNDRMNAATWVYQFSILTIIINVISVPYNAAIISNERMNIFAYVSILEVSLKLLIVFMLGWFHMDMLILYAILIFIVTSITKFVYINYSVRNFPEANYNMMWDEKMFKSLLSFTGWNLWGNAASVIYTQGVNILLNIFFGPTINAARGISFQVRTAIYSFVQNFQMAMRPQIIKYYALDDLKHMHQLIFSGSKFSFFLLYALTLPILLETEIILKLWLKIVPNYTIIFTKLIIINVLIDSISGTLMTAAQATGKIKLYQSVVGGLLMLILPISYVFLRLGFEPQITLYVSIFISIIALYSRLKIITPLINITIMQFIKNVIPRILLTVLISILVPFSLRILLSPDSLRAIILVLVSVISCVFTTYFIGINKKEQILVKENIRILKLKIK